MSYELIALLIFASMLVMLLTGQRIFAAIGGVATVFALLLWGEGAEGMPFHASFVLLNWYPLLTLPLFIYMGYMFSESGIADDMYNMFHVWMGPLNGGLAVGTIGLMVAIAAMNGLSVAASMTKSWSPASSRRAVPWASWSRPAWFWFSME
jgi:TRAP-type mannitol/chloroaromatic compound transport system permease large subunit